MYKVRMEYYTNNYTRQHSDKWFDSLEEVFEWAKKKSRDFSAKRGYWFKGEKRDYTVDRDSVSRIEFATLEDRPFEEIWIHQIETEEGIVFADGYYTKGEKYCSKNVNKWLTECQEKAKEKPKFVED